MENAIYRYSGRRRDGTAVTGATNESPDRLAERLYHAGWRQLRITRDGDDVGGIGQLLDTGRRHWWGESDQEIPERN